MNLLPLSIFRQIIAGQLNLNKLLAALRDEIASTPGHLIYVENIQKGILKKYEDQLVQVLRGRLSKDHPVVAYLMDHFRLKRASELEELWEERDLIEVAEHLAPYADVIEQNLGGQGSAVYKLTSGEPVSVEVLEEAHWEIEKNARRMDLTLSGLNDEIKMLESERARGIASGRWIEDPNLVEDYDRTIREARANRANAQEEYYRLDELSRLLERMSEDPYALDYP